MGRKQRCGRAFYLESLDRTGAQPCREDYVAPDAIGRRLPRLDYDDYPQHPVRERQRGLERPAAQAVVQRLIDAGWLFRTATVALLRVLVDGKAQPLGFNLGRLHLSGQALEKIPTGRQSSPAWRLSA